MAIISSDIESARNHLNQGEIVAIPTETVYGLSGNATNEKSIARIFEAKKRPSFDPLIVHFYNKAKVKEFGITFPPLASQLADKFWPGPLTLILPRPAAIPLIVTSGLDTVGVRVPRHPLTRELLFQLDYPLAAPSANPFGYVSPTTAQHVEDQLSNDIPFILDGGPCTVGLESTIVGFEDEKPVIYRMGGISKDEIETVIGPVNFRHHSTSDPKAPGMLKSHYSPGKELLLGNIKENLESCNMDRTGVLSFSNSYEDVPSEHQRILSPTGDMKVAATNLFSYLRDFSTMDIDVVLAEEVPDHDLGMAINDRLRRAAAK